MSARAGAAVPLTTLDDDAWIATERIAAARGAG